MQIGRASASNALFVGIICLALSGCFKPPREETRPSRYPTLIREWTPSGLVAHFPNPLPAAATNVRVSAFPGYLQGGAWFQVRFNLPAAHVANIYATAAKNAKDFYDGGNCFTSESSKTNGLVGTSFRTSEGKASSFAQVDFPDDYRVFVLFAQPGDTNSWNHGRSKGVVVSTQRTEVIYFAESW